jgi:transposase-like protein
MTLPRRQFDPHVPLFTKGRRPIPETEDRALTACVLRALREARSRSEVPPVCPHCGSRATILASRPHARMPRPTFRCRDCGRCYNRLTGTPLARLRHEDKLLAFARLLSQQISYAQAAARLDVDYTAIANWVAKFRLWLLQIDPSGEWESRVRIGVKPRPDAPCPRCGVRAVRFHGFDSQTGERRMCCASCRAVFPLIAIGEALELVEAYDPAIASGRLVWRES